MLCLPFFFIRFVAVLREGPRISFFFIPGILFLPAVAGRWSDSFSAWAGERLSRGLLPQPSGIHLSSTICEMELRPGHCNSIWVSSTGSHSSDTRDFWDQEQTRWIIHPWPWKRGPKTLVWLMWPRDSVISAILSKGFCRSLLGRPLDSNRRSFSCVRGAVWFHWLRSCLIAQGYDRSTYPCGNARGCGC